MRNSKDIKNEDLRDTLLPIVNGAFKELEYGKTFHYGTTTDEYALKHGMFLEFVSEAGHRRFCKVGKTVAYIAVDENPDGTPKLEKWHIKRQWHTEKEPQQ